MYGAIKVYYLGVLKCTTLGVKVYNLGGKCPIVIDKATLFDIIQMR